jgi:hypothetical protein
MGWYDRCCICWGVTSHNGYCFYCEEKTEKYLEDPIIKIPPTFASYMMKQKDLDFRIRFGDGELII